MVKVTQVNDRGIWFDDGSFLSSDHEQECCEHHYLDFSAVTEDDFSDLDFDLAPGKFFEKVEGYGIRLIPTNGHPVSIPGYGSNNGYYSSNLTLTLVVPDYEMSFNITECQVIT